MFHIVQINISLGNYILSSKRTNGHSNVTPIRSVGCYNKICPPTVARFLIVPCVHNVIQASQTRHTRTKIKRRVSVCGRPPSAGSISEPPNLGLEAEQTRGNSLKSRSIWDISVWCLRIKKGGPVNRQCGVARREREKTCHHEKGGKCNYHASLCGILCIFFYLLVVSSFYRLCLFCYLPLYTLYIRHTDLCYD